ncbi:MAG TPA: MFS transporter [Clostridiales bacterium]|jgi:Na+/melibiose symporter-like transporter|nr:MFS transporter [Clostridiales bacterium]
MKEQTFESSDVKLSMKEKLAFSAGELYGSGATSLVASVYMVFLVLNGLTATQAASIIMLAKIWDAVTDPAMGIISDNTRTKWGRRRPYIFVGAFMLIFSLAMLFMPLHTVESNGFKYFVYLLAYLIYNTLSTMINVPYLSMTAELTTDYDEKNKLNIIRQGFAMAAGAISAGVPIFLLEKLHKRELTLKQFSFLMIVGFGIYYAIPLLLASVFGRERAAIPKEKVKFSLSNFLLPLRLKAFVYLLLMYFLAYSALDLITTNIVWVVKYGFEIKSYSSFIVLALISVSYAVTIPLYNILMRKNYAKPLLYRAGVPIYILGIVILGLYPAGFNDYLILPICVIIGFGMSGAMLMPWIIFPDVVDVGTLKFGSRNTGSYSGLMTFVRKSTTAVSILISGIVLDATGFKKPITDYATGLVESFEQPTSAIWGLRAVLVVPITVFMLIAYIAAKKLTLNSDRSRLIQRLNNGEDIRSESEAAELAAIQKELF